MEVQAAHPPSCSSSAAAAYPRWVLLEPYAKIVNVEDGSPCITADAAKTLATATTSTGHRINVALVGLAEPPATSSLRVELTDDAGVRIRTTIIISAHADSLLIQVNLERQRHGGYGRDSTLDHFVYSAGAGDAADDPPRPPSLVLLPPFNGTDSIDRFMGTYDTGILRRGEDEIIVAKLCMEPAVSNDTPETKVAKLFMFQSGEWDDWDVRCPRICSSSKDIDELEELPSRWSTEAVIVVPVGDRTLCWVDLTCGILLCDVLEDSPLLHYLPLPAVPCLGTASHRNLHATAGGELKFVNIFPRCCCGGVGVSSCQHSNNAYTIHTWTLRMDDMVWVMDAMIDATELWALQAYKGLPRVPLDYPIVSMDEPHVISFQLCEDYHVKHGGDMTLWLLMVDTRRKTIQSVSRHPDDWFPGFVPIPSEVSYYLNSHPTTCGSHHMPKVEGQIISQMDIEKHRDNDSRISVTQSSCKSSVEPPVQASEILELFQEIPSYGLSRDDILKAYSILSHGDSRRFRSLLGLPLNLRKDWLLMEIRACEAYPQKKKSL